MAAAMSLAVARTSTISPIGIMGGSGPLPPALLLGLLAVAVLASVLMLFAYRSRRGTFPPSDFGG
jgi:hypothetical protein